MGVSGVRRRAIRWGVGALFVVCAAAIVAAWQVPERTEAGFADGALSVTISPTKPELWANAYGEDVSMRLSETRSLFQELGAPRELTIEIFLAFTRRGSDASVDDLGWQLETSQPIVALSGSIEQSESEEGERRTFRVGSWLPTGDIEGYQVAFEAFVEDDPGNDGYQRVDIYMPFKVKLPVVSQGSYNGQAHQSVQVVWAPSPDIVDWHTMEDSDGDGRFDGYADEPDAQVRIALCDSCDVEEVFAREEPTTPFPLTRQWRIPVNRTDYFEFTTAWRPWAGLREVWGWVALTVAGAIIALIVEGALSSRRSSGMSNDGGTSLAVTATPPVPVTPKASKPARQKRRRRKRK